MKSIIKRTIAVLLVLTVALLTACSVTLDTVKAAVIGGGDDVNLDNYGEYISNEELGEIVSYGGYISKKEYVAMIRDGSVGASYNPSFAFCYDTNGYVIHNRTLKYTVTGMDVVGPDDSGKLEVVRGKDLLTLVTCTPYGVNSHRLLVHAERTPFEDATFDSAATVSQVTRTVPKSHQLQIVIAGFAVIAVVALKIYFWRRKRKRLLKSEVTK